MAEANRLKEDASRNQNWKRWGPYLSERQWGTVREDYSPDGSCWNYLSHDQARSRAYRWGEDGLLGVTDRQCRLCFGLALWNEKDPILKERLYGLTGPQGNHGEDVKECYYYLESTPTHSYMKGLYKYPQKEYPYSWLEHENGGRGVHEPEFELEDTGVFKDSEYWDVFVEYAKRLPNDMLMKITVVNRGPEPATLHVLPTLWYRNTWIWGCTHEGCTRKPRLRSAGEGKLEGAHETLGKSVWEVDKGPNGQLPPFLFTENETNSALLHGIENYTPYVKDAFHRYVINGEKDAISPNKRGTKVAAHYVVHANPGEKVELRCRLYEPDDPPGEVFGNEFEKIFSSRKVESEEFHQGLFGRLPAEQQKVARQAAAGLLWSKQFYHYVVEDWLKGDPEQPPPPQERLQGRNSDWGHLFNKDIVSMPDKWEYPWYASWDLAFHMLPFSILDAHFAKEQLLIFLREWYMHPNGQIPAYEFAFGDVNPPVHAWAVTKVCRVINSTGNQDTPFLARCFQKLLLNFTWWVNRKDPDGNNIFAGGFLGLDNIGIFDRSKPLPIAGGTLEQADGTAWMAFFCLCMLNMALDLAEDDPVYEDMASKFFEHFILIVDAMNKVGHGGGLWDEKDGFYYDYIRTQQGRSIPLRIRSLVGLVPLFSCLVLEESRLCKLPGFRKRTEWFIKYRTDLASQISYMNVGDKERYLLAIPSKLRMLSLLRYLLDEEEFLSPYGIRSLSKVHQDHPFVLELPNGYSDSVHYMPGESDTHMFGGNSNWRGPIWLCMNFLIVEVLQRYHYYYGDELQVECPVGSGVMMSLDKVAEEISGRVVKLFLPDKDGHRPCHGGAEQYASDPAWKDLVLFYEYFHGDTGRGCGASHQTGWTALVLDCMLLCQDKT